MKCWYYLLIFLPDAGKWICLCVARGLHISHGCTGAWQNCSVDHYWCPPFSRNASASVTLCQQWLICWTCSSSCVRCSLLAKRQSNCELHASNDRQPQVFWDLAASCVIVRCLSCFDAMCSSDSLAVLVLLFSWIKSHLCVRSLGVRIGYHSSDIVLCK